MSMIGTFNRAVSDAINKGDPNYVAILGTENFTPEATIVDSADFNCGGLANELEFLRTVSNYYIQSFDLDVAEDENLEALVQAFIDMPRRDTGESDAIYRKRFRFINNEKVNTRRTTRWAILDAISYFVTDASKVQLIETDENNLYFQVRIEGTIDYTNTLFLNSATQGFLNNFYIGGAGIGFVISFLGDLIDRIKAAGVDYDIVFVAQSSITKTVDTIIGSVQMYKTVDAVVKAPVSFTKTIDARIL